MRCLGCALAAYVVVWLTVADRLFQLSVREKTLVVATMTAATSQSATTQPSEEIEQRWRQLQPSIQKVDLTFHQCDLGHWTPAWMERQFLKAATELAALPESDPKFLTALARYNYFADALRERSANEEPPWQMYIGEHAYSGCSASIPEAGHIGLRDSAKLYIRYAEPFADALPYSQLSPLADPDLQRNDVLQKSKSIRSTLIRAVPLSILAAPWQMFAFKDSSFAEICRGMPQAVLFLLLAFHFIADLRFESIGEDGLFAQQMTPSRKVCDLIWFLVVMIPLIILRVEGRETWIEAFRLPFMCITILFGAALLFCLDAMRISPLSQRFMEMDFNQRRVRLIPFAIGAACIVTAATWGLNYSLRLILRIDAGSALRGVAQGAALCWMIYLVFAIALRLLFTSQMIRTTSATAPALPPPNPLFRELSKALALVVSPLAVQLLNYFTSN